MKWICSQSISRGKGKNERKKYGWLRAELKRKEERQHNKKHLVCSVHRHIFHPCMYVFFLFNFKLTEQGVSKEHKKDIRPQIKEDDEEGKNYMRKFMVSFYAL